MQAPPRPSLGLESSGHLKEQQTNRYSVGAVRYWRTEKGPGPDCGSSGEAGRVTKSRSSEEGDTRLAESEAAHAPTPCTRVSMCKGSKGGWGSARKGGHES